LAAHDGLSGDLSGSLRLAEMAVSVVAVQETSVFFQELAASAGFVVCVLFHADWSAGNFGPEDLALLASSGTGPRCISVNAGTEEGEEIALSLGVEVLPAVRFYMPPATEHVMELAGTQCEQKAITDAAERFSKAKDTATVNASCCPQPKPVAGGIRDFVRGAYAQTAVGGAGVLPLDVGDIKRRRGILGYEGDVNESADLGLGCGNPLVTAKLQLGEVVLDLGSGAGMDCFLAAQKVGPSGHVLGVDMTPEMISKARATARQDGVQNVSFRLGEIEHLPVGDGVIDCLISNCVINLSPDKQQVYNEMNRVLTPGGRISISDVLRTGDIPTELKTAQSYAC